MSSRLNLLKQFFRNKGLYDSSGTHAFQYTVHLMKVLGIESSADETSAAVVEDGYKLLSNVVASSMDIHAAYGGVVPEIAARSHIEAIIPVIDQALTDAFQGASLEMGEMWSNIDAIAVTVGPGLSGSLLIGVLTARTLAIAKNKPLYTVNHVEAHVYANFLTEVVTSSQSSVASYKLPKRQPEFPLLALIVSGGHTQLVLFQDHFKYTVLGQTADDAAGEAYDKVAKILGLPYPGGPSIDKESQNGNHNAIKLPKAKMQSPYEFSFSGLKTAVLRASQQIVGKDFTFPSFEIAELLNAQQKGNIAASFQKTAVETLVDAVQAAEKEFSPKSVVIAGGVAANRELRSQLKNCIKTEVTCPDIKLCTDNAAMIASLGCFKSKLNQPTADPYSVDIFPNFSM